MGELLFAGGATLVVFSLLGGLITTFVLLGRKKKLNAQLTLEYGEKKKA